jgi:hypothetical protein
MNIIRAFLIGLARPDPQLRIVRCLTLIPIPLRCDCAASVMQRTIEAMRLVVFFLFSKHFTDAAASIHSSRSILPATLCYQPARTGGLRRLLKYWSDPRRCRCWRWPRRERSVDISSNLGPASNAESFRDQSRRNPAGERLKERLAASITRCTPLWGCASLASRHPHLLRLRAGHSRISTVF